MEIGTIRDMILRTLGGITGRLTTGAPHLLPGKDGSEVGGLASLTTVGKGINTTRCVELASTYGKEVLAVTTVHALQPFLRGG